MIVRHHPEGWKIISHYTHALLAGKIGSHIKSTLFHSHWLETITAIINHDDHMVDFDATDYLTEAGTPRDFMMRGGSRKDAVIHAKSLYNDIQQKSQWISMLVSRHLEFLYGDLPDPEMKLFLDEMHEKRKVQRRLYGINQGTEDSLYEILRFCDRLSLIICGEEVPVTGRRLEINTSINKETYFISLNDDGCYKISPWIFEQEQFEIDFEFKVLNQVKYVSNKELEKVLDATEVEIMKVSFTR